MFLNKCAKIVFIVIIVLFNVQLKAQRVGLVLSGGGASGLAHIGVLKALEQDSIPIDYITGTSMGALVGALYAVGYSPSEIERMALSEDFRNWAYGRIEDKHVYYFKRKDDNASWLPIKLSLDSIIKPSLPTNLISPIPVDFALMQILSPPIASVNYKFDSLFVPFRCLASDIEDKKSVVFREGNLSQAVRASMSYPFYLKPISVDGKLLFDGGIYNNFPANIMYNDFLPDIIIGSNVSGNEPAPQEDDIISQLKTMLLAKTDFNIACENGIIIQPPVSGTATFNFDNIEYLIDAGYIATLKKMKEIKGSIADRCNLTQLAQKREDFRMNQYPLVFDSIKIDGLNKSQSEYVVKILRAKQKQISASALKPAYFRIASDDKIKGIYPLATFNPKGRFYSLNLKIRKENDIITEFGGNISNRPIQEGYFGLQYNYLGKTSATLGLNTYFGKLYNSGQIRLRVDFPTRIPFYLEPNFTINKWNFFNSSTQFITDVKPPFLIQNETFLNTNIAFPLGNKAKLVFGNNYATLINEYYQSTQFTQKDTADRTSFKTWSSNVSIEMNSLNRKQYASKGRYFTANFRYVNGREFFIPGSTSINKDTIDYKREWFQFRTAFDKYFKSRGFYRFGISFEGVYSLQPFFSNYNSSILSAPAFQPIPESKTLFQEKYRAHKFIAAGVKNIFAVRNIAELRIEAYVYQPYQKIVREKGLIAAYTAPFAYRYYIATATVVAHTFVGPFAIGVNYYSESEKPLTFMFHFGYILFNKKALE